MSTKGNTADEKRVSELVISELPLASLSKRINPGAHPFMWKLVFIHMQRELIFMWKDEHQAPVVQTLDSDFINII